MLPSHPNHYRSFIEELREAIPVQIPGGVVQLVTDYSGGIAEKYCQGSHYDEKNDNELLT